MQHETRLYKYIVFVFFIGIIFHNPLFSASPAVDNFNQAQKLYQSHQYFEASGFLQKALKANPYYTDAQILLGDCYFAMENYTAAWDIYLQVEKKTPNDPDILVKLAKTKLKTATSYENIAATEMYLKKAYQLAPRNSQVYEVYGEFYMKMNNYQKALDYYNNLGNVDNPNVYINKAHIYESWGQYEKALGELKKAENLESKNYKVLLEMSKVYNLLGDDEKSTIYLNTAYSYNPKDRDILEALSTSYIKQKDFNGASQKIGQLIQNDKTNVGLYYQLALCYEQMGNYDAVIKTLLDGLQYDYGNEFLRIKAEEVTANQLPLDSKIRPKLADFYKKKGKNLLIDGRQEDALFYLKRALHIDPVDIQTRLDIADIYRNKSYLYEYINLLKGGVFLDPSSSTDLKDKLMLNSKFIVNSLEYRENIPSKSLTTQRPILMIQDLAVSGSQYSYFQEDAKEVLLESLSNQHSIHVITNSPANNIEPDFKIQMTIEPHSNKIRIMANIIYIKTGSTYLSYDLTEYGNNPLLSGFQDLANKISEDMPHIASILKIDGNTAIINMGAQQGIRKGQNMTILNNSQLPDKFFATGSIDPAWEIATAKVVDLGENISQIQFKPLDRLIFNMVQQNQSIIIQHKGKNR